MTYATDTLLALLPVALESGLGRPQVERIRNLERATRGLWLEREVDTEAEYDAVFAALCQRHDGPDWDLANLRRALEAEIAECAEISIHYVSLELDQRLAGRRTDDPGTPWPAGIADTEIEALDGPPVLRRDEARREGDRTPGPPGQRRIGG